MPEELSTLRTWDHVNLRGEKQILTCELSRGLGHEQAQDLES
jgi:hypothetical protein